MNRIGGYPHQTHFDNHTPEAPQRRPESPPAAAGLPPRSIHELVQLSPRKLTTDEACLLAQYKQQHDKATQNPRSIEFLAKLHPGQLTPQEFAMLEAAGYSYTRSKEYADALRQPQAGAPANQKSRGGNSEQPTAPPGRGQFGTNSAVAIGSRDSFGSMRQPPPPPSRGGCSQERPPTTTPAQQKPSQGQDDWQPARRGGRHR